MEKSYFQIDPKIQNLVACMNTCGMKTYASCQGHGFPVRKLLPYVAFMAPLPLAQNLARLVREDAESLSPRLCWGWEVTEPPRFSWRVFSPGTQAAIAPFPMEA